MPELKQQINIGRLSLTNRLIMSPIACERADDGHVSPELLSFYEQRATEGLYGLVITEQCYVENRGKASHRMLSLADDSCIPGLQRLTDVIKKGGSKVFAQLNHAGSASSTRITGRLLAAPSSLANISRSSATEIPVELKLPEIGRVVEAFAEAARRAVSSGYDGIEIHAAHGYLLNQFYSPLLNKRSDEYGADSIENRLRIHTEIISAIKATVGSAVPVAVRFGCCDYMDGGSTIPDAVLGAKLLESAGADMIDVTGGLCSYDPECREGIVFEDMSRCIKDNVTVPVMLTGGIRTLPEMERLLGSSCADLIGVGRPLLRDPQWTKKLLDAY